MSNVNPSVNLM